VNDFSGACKYFLAQVCHLHCRSQLENSKYTKKCSIGCFGGCGRFDGHSGGCILVKTLEVMNAEEKCLFSVVGLWSSI
jgi:hypothetical protein